jgi:Family of unknown function (DUF6932)
MLPDLKDDGQLPPGIHEACWREFCDRYGTTAHRRRLIEGLKLLVDHLKSVGCEAVYVDGSFVTGKERPNDYDACWDLTGVKIEAVDKTLLDFSDEGKQEMQAKYRGDIRPDSCSPIESDATYLEFFQTDRDGNPKGIVKLRLSEL